MWRSRKSAVEIREYVYVYMGTMIRPVICNLLIVRYLRLKVTAVHTYMDVSIQK